MAIAPFVAHRLRLHAPPLPVRAVLALLVLAAVAAGITLVRPAASTGDLTASGTLEVEEVNLAVQAPGRLVELDVDEGSRVAEGQRLGRVADPVLDVEHRQAVVDPAQSQVSAAQLARLELRAPSAGVIQKRLARPGEVVAAGVPILTLADPTQLKLTLYVPESELGRVYVDQHVALRSDATGADVFDARVTSIATRAEFTPRNVQTQRDRQNLVFGVSVRVANPRGVLKAGLPVDATFLP
jgi:HlyD family secretion protein